MLIVLCGTCAFSRLHWLWVLLGFSSIAVPSCQTTLKEYWGPEGITVHYANTGHERERERERDSWRKKSLNSWFFFSSDLALLQELNPPGVVTNHRQVLLYTHESGVRLSSQSLSVLRRELVCLVVCLSRSVQLNVKPLNCHSNSQKFSFLRLLLDNHHHHLIAERERESERKSWESTGYLYLTVKDDAFNSLLLPCVCVVCVCVHVVNWAKEIT